ncbi:MAG: hypothetical protein ACYC6G_14020 [Desulfobaccales bacterium]
MSDHFNSLEPDEAERLAILLGEMAEASHIIGKILQHGYESYHPKDPKTTNRMLLEDELGHVLFGMRLLAKTDIAWGLLERSCREKTLSIIPYLHHQEGYQP